jgi:isoamylase
VFAIRHAHPVFRRRHFFRGTPVKEGAKDLMWIRPDGQEMTEGDWGNAGNKALGALLNGEATDDTDERGRTVRDETMLLLTNASEQEVRFTLPQIAAGGRWAELIDTTRHRLRMIDAGWVGLAPHSLTLLRFGEDRRLTVEVPSREGSAVAGREAKIE